MGFDPFRLRRSLNQKQRDSVRKKVRSNLDKLEKKLGRKVILVQRHLVRSALPQRLVGCIICSFGPLLLTGKILEHIVYGLLYDVRCPLAVFFLMVL